MLLRTIHDMSYFQWYSFNGKPDICIWGNGHVVFFWLDSLGLNPAFNMAGVWPPRTIVRITWLAPL